MNINSEDSSQKNADQPEAKLSRPELIKEVLGPLTVLAEPIYVPDDEGCPVLLATAPNGLAVAIEDSDYFMYADYPVSIFRNLEPGDIIVCTAAIRADSWTEYAGKQTSWERMYHAGGSVYQLVDGKAVELFEQLMRELDEADEQHLATALVQ